MLLFKKESNFNHNKHPKIHLLLLPCPLRWKEAPMRDDVGVQVLLDFRPAGSITLLLQLHA